MITLVFHNVTGEIVLAYVIVFKDFQIDESFLITAREIFLREGM